MSNKKFSDFENPMDAIVAFTNMMGNGATLGHFFGGLFEDPKEKHPYDRLGNGYELRPIELSEEEMKDDRLVGLKYSHLYHNDTKVSDLIFRKGGYVKGFKDGYCALIHYTRTPKGDSQKDLFSFGDHVLINEEGEIAMKGGSFSSNHPYHIGGHIASLGNYIYDLRTGKCIAPKSSTTIKGMNSVIIEHRYEWYDKEVKLPLGVYRVDFWTAEVTKIDDVK
jgi:hypothetical protein